MNLGKLFNPVQRQSSRERFRVLSLRRLWRSIGAYQACVRYDVRFHVERACQGVRETHKPRATEYYVLVPFTSSDMEVPLVTIWHKARLRKHGHAAFVLLLLVYVPHPRAQRLTSLRRATDTRIQEKLPRAAAFMSETGIEGGASTQRHAVVSQARLPDGSIEEVPHNTTFRQLQFINRQQNTMEQERAVQHARCDEAYRLVRVQIHGVTMPMLFNVGDLRDALERPSYRLHPPHRVPQHLDVPDPSMDITDADHEDGGLDAEE